MAGAEVMKCDFCSSPDVRWRYPARDFDGPRELGVDSVGEWLACEACHLLIERGDRGGLAERSLELARPEAQRSNLAFEQPELLLPVLRDFHERFYQHRIGPAEPYPCTDRSSKT